MITTNKRDQITAFVIVGILFVAMISLFLFMKKDEYPETGGKTETNLKSVFESCLEENIGVIDQKVSPCKSSLIQRSAPHAILCDKIP